MYHYPKAIKWLISRHEPGKKQNNQYRNKHRPYTIDGYVSILYHTLRNYHKINYSFCFKWVWLLGWRLLHDHLCYLDTLYKTARSDIQFSNIIYKLITPISTSITHRYICVTVHCFPNIPHYGARFAYYVYHLLLCTDMRFAVTPNKENHWII